MIEYPRYGLEKASMLVNAEDVFDVASVVVALLPETTQAPPTSQVWVAPFAATETTAQDGYSHSARIDVMLGPTGTFAPVEGRYYLWAKVVTATEAPQLRCPEAITVC